MFLICNQVYKFMEFPSCWKKPSGMLGVTCSRIASILQDWKRPHQRPTLWPVATVSSIRSIGQASATDAGWSERVWWSTWTGVVGIKNSRLLSTEKCRAWTLEFYSRKSVASVSAQRSAAGRSAESNSVALVVSKSCHALQSFWSNVRGPLLATGRSCLDWTKVPVSQKYPCCTLAGSKIAVLWRLWGAGRPQRSVCAELAADPWSSWDRWCLE